MEELAKFLDLLLFVDLTLLPDGEDSVQFRSRLRGTAHVADYVEGLLQRVDELFSVLRAFLLAVLDHVIRQIHQR